VKTTSPNIFVEMLTNEVSIDTIAAECQSVARIPKALGAKCQSSRGPGRQSEWGSTSPRSPSAGDAVPRGILQEGFLGKRHTRGFTLFPKRWQMRYVVADGTKEELQYMLAEGSTQSRGSIPFSDIVRVGRTRGSLGGTHFEIELSINAASRENAGRVYYFRAADPREADLWIATLFNAAPALQSRRASLPPGVSRDDDTDITIDDVLSNTTSPKVHSAWGVQSGDGKHQSKPKLLELKDLSNNERAAAAAGLRPPTGGANSGVFSNNKRAGDHRTRRARRQKQQQNNESVDPTIDELMHKGVCCTAGGCVPWSVLMDKAKRRR
jgi:hypothetical protein